MSRLSNVLAARVRRFAASRWAGPAALAIAIAFYYWQVLLDGRLIDDSSLAFSSLFPWKLHPPGGLGHANPALLDSVVSLAPAMTFVRESLAHGQLPLWNPYTEFGFPFFEQSQWGILSPVGLPYLAPPSLYSIATAQTLVAILKTAAAGGGAYLLGRRLRFTRGAALFSAIAFMFGGYVTVWLSMPASSVAVILPWACLGLELVLTSPRPWLGAAAFAVALAALVFGGHPEVVAYALLALVVYAVVRALQERRALRGQLRLRGAAVLVGALLAAGLCAVLLLPAQELLGRSVDSAQRSSTYGHYFVAWHALTHVVAPDSDGSPLRGRMPLGPGYSAFIAPWYVGVVALVGVGVALVARDRRALPFLAICAAAVTIAMNLWPWRVVESAVPSVGGILKTNALATWSFALALIAGVGADRLQRAIAARRARTLWLGPAVVGALCAALLVELYSWGHAYNPRVPRSRVGVPLVPGLRELPAGAGEPRTAYLGQAVRPLLAMEFDRSDVRSYGQPTRRDYDAFMTRVIARYASVYPTYVYYAIGTVRPNALRMLAAAGARFAAYADGQWGGLPAVYRRAISGPLNVLDLGPGVTRASVIDRFEAIPDEARALRRVGSPTFDPQSEVVLDRAPAGIAPFSSPPGLLPPSRPPPLGIAPSAAQPNPPPTLTRYSNNDVELRATLRKPGLAVLWDSIYPGWSARVDGSPARIYRADGLFRAVALAPGTHRVSFSYRPARILVGALISLLSLAGVVALALWGRGRTVPPRAPRPGAAE